MYVRCCDNAKNEKRKMGGGEEKDEIGNIGTAGCELVAAVIAEMYLTCPATSCTWITEY